MQDGSNQNERIREFLNREFQWSFSAGECNFLIQLLAFIVETNPAIVADKSGQKSPLNYQSIRSAVLLNEKLAKQLQKSASEASVILGDVDPVSERIQ